MDRCSEDEKKQVKLGPTAATVRRRSSSSDRLGGISCSWSRELGTLCTPMNNGEVARVREEEREVAWVREEGRVLLWRQEEEGLRQRCSSDWRGGSSTGSVLLGCTHCCSAWSPLLPCIFLSLYFSVSLFFIPSLPLLSLFFLPAPATRSIQNT